MRSLSIFVNTEFMILLAPYRSHLLSAPFSLSLTLHPLRIIREHTPPAQRIYPGIQTIQTHLDTTSTMSSNSNSPVQDMEDFGITNGYGGSTATAATGSCRQSRNNCPKRIQGSRPPPRDNTPGKAPVDDYGRRGAIDMGRPDKKT